MEKKSITDCDLCALWNGNDEIEVDVPMEEKKILAYSPTNFQLMKGCRFACFFHFSSLFSMVRFFFEFIFYSHFFFFFSNHRKFCRILFIRFNNFFFCRLTHNYWLVFYVHVCLCIVDKKKIRFPFYKMKKKEG